MKTKTLTMTLTVILVIMVIVALLSTLASISRGDRLASLQKKAKNHYAEQLDLKDQLRVAHEATESALKRAEAADAKLSEKVRDEAAQTKDGKDLAETIAALKAKSAEQERAIAKDREELAAWKADLERREAAMREEYLALQKWGREMEAWADKVESGAAARRSAADQSEGYRNALADVERRQQAAREQPDYQRRLVEAAEARNLELQMLNTQLRALQSDLELDLGR